MARFRLTRAARRELSEIRAYLLARSPDGAATVTAAIAAQIDTIAQFPALGPVIERRGPYEYRRIVAGAYVIWYRLADGGSVLVLGVRHGRRSPLTPDDLHRRDLPDDA